MTDERLRRAERDGQVSPAARARLYRERARLGLPALDPEPGPVEWSSRGRFIAGCWTERCLLLGMPVIMSAVHEASGEAQLLRLTPLSTPLGAAEMHTLQHTQRWVEALRSVRHPGIPVVFEVGFHPEEGEFPRLLFVREELGPTLTGRERLRREGRLAWREALAIARQAAQVLLHAHTSGIVHGRVMPSRLLLPPEGGQLMLTGWRDLRSVSTPDGGEELEPGGPRRRGEANYGTFVYGAPEQLLGSLCRDPRCDVYGLGITLYELLTRHLPFRWRDSSERQRAICEEPALDPRAHAPDLPDEVVRLVLRALEKSPERRPSMQALLAALEALLAGEALPPGFAPGRSPLGWLRQAGQRLWGG